LTTGISVVVVRWRGGDEVARCLASIRDQGGPRVEKTVLVDSGSGDGGAAGLADAFPDVDVLELEVNRSFAWAANRGVEETRSPLLAVLNPDTQVRPGCFDLLAEHLENHPQVAGCVPLLISPNGRSQHRWQLRDLPTIFRLATGRAGRPAFVQRAPGAETPVAQPAAASWLVRRSVWDALGGFDPQFAPAWWEDVDFCRRLADGVRTGSVRADTGFEVVPAARMIHEGGSSLSSLPDDRFVAMYHRNLVRYVHRHHASSAARIVPLIRLSLRLRAFAKPRRSRSYLAAREAIR